jgi:RNA polymerase sigma-70 factor (ECF subfamily)
MDHSSKEKFVNLVYDNINIIYKICRIYSSEDHEDLQQEIIYQLWKAYPSFQGKSKFQTWMYRVALNTAIVGFRKRKITTIPINQALNNSLIEAQDTTKQQIELLYRHIACLDAVEKAVIFLYLEKCSYEEISKVLGLTPGNVGVKINRIKKKLREMFEVKSNM